MASVNESPNTTARTQLDFALGKNRVLLSDLSTKEFDEFLKSSLDKVNLRELRGFQPLNELVINNHFGLSEKVSFDATGFKADDPINLTTHILNVSRGWHDRVSLFRRYESNEETTDSNVAETWGKSGYVVKGSGSILALRRPRNHGYAYDNMVSLAFNYEKVILKSEYVVTALTVQHLTVENFRQHFGVKYPRIATELIWELRTAHIKTANMLESQAKDFRKKAVQFDCLGKAIFYR